MSRANMRYYEYESKRSTSMKNLSKIMETPEVIKKSLEKDNKSRSESPIIDMKEYCRTLFTSEKVQN